METKNRSHISVILDRSGSMATIKDDIISGFNTFLNSQKKLSSDCTFTLIQFDSVNPYEVIYDFRPISEVAELNEKTFVPRGTTPLLDCIGRGIKDIESKLASNTSEKIERIFFVIITDGKENSSREFKKDDIVKLIEEKQSKDKWEFIFLSTDLEAISDAHSYGFNQAATAHFNKNPESVRYMMNKLSHSMLKARADFSYKISFKDFDDQLKEDDK